MIDAAGNNMMGCSRPFLAEGFAIDRRIPLWHGFSLST